MKKKGHAAGISFVALITVGFIAAGVGTQSWTVATFSATVISNLNQTCIVTRTLGLFSVTDSFNEICRVSDTATYDVYCKDLISFNHGLQYAVIVFCGFSMLCCLIIIAVGAFNVCENPYQTYCTAFGLTIYNGIGLLCSLLAVILYVVLLYTDLQAPIEKNQPDGGDSCAKSSSNGGVPVVSRVYMSEGYRVKSPGYFGYSFFLVMSSIFVYCIGIGLSIHAQRDRKRKVPNRQVPGSENDAYDPGMIF